MKTFHRIGKNISALTASKLITLIIGYIYTVLVARYLGPESYGILVFAITLNNLFGTIINFGYDPLMVREVAKERKLGRSYLMNGIILKLFFGVFTFILIYLFINILKYPLSTQYVVYIMAISTIITSIGTLFINIYQAYEKMEFTGVVNIIKSTLLLIFAICGIILKFGIIYYAYIYVISNFILLLINIIIINRLFIKISINNVHINIKYWHKLIKLSLPFALTSIFVNTYYYFDTIMISYMKGNFEVGIYYSAYKLAMAGLVIPQIYFSSLYPTLSRLYVTRIKLFTKIIRISLTIMLPLSLIVGILGTYFSQFLIISIYGNEYNLSIPIFSVLIWSVAISFLNSLFATILDVTNNQILNSIRMGIGVTVNVLLNLLLIPPWGALGAAYATLITRILIGMLAYIFVHIKVKINLIPKGWSDRK